MTHLEDLQDKFCVAHFEYMTEEECKAMQTPNGSLRLTPQLTGYRKHSDALEVAKKSEVKNVVVIQECDIYETDRPFYDFSEILEMTERAQVSCVVQSFKGGE
ncbi:MAG: hypothetical protein NE327_21090 [Lentisphaeraceae bacterium]|nr:hypothetical protein [Lentisphaeraceae bacterium]